jgi:hypothetical protein
MHPWTMTIQVPLAAPEIAAGGMQLQPVDENSYPGAVAALGSHVKQAMATWVARDAISAMPRAYVSLLGTDPSSQSARVVSALGIVGSPEDGPAAEDVIRRYASQALGISAS